MTMPGKRLRKKNAGGDFLSTLKIVGARVHNLKNINLNIPKNKFVVFTGVSGSGKSSLAFDTLFAEGQRRYIESLSSYARQFLGQMEKPPFDHIYGLSPTISIDQKSVSRNPRSTVGTITEIYDYLRVFLRGWASSTATNADRKSEAGLRTVLSERFLILKKAGKSGSWLR
jgi:excinuclease ABC subunit A